MEPAAIKRTRPDPIRTHTGRSTARTSITPPTADNATNTFTRSSAAAIAARFFADMIEQADQTTYDPEQPPPLRPRSKPGISQAECARRMGITDRHLRTVIQRGTWNETLVTRFEAAVGLDQDIPERVPHRVVLWELTLGRRPPGLVTAITDADRMHVDLQGAPTYISNNRWDLVYANRSFYRWFPELADGGNILTFCLGETGQRILPDWEPGWVVPMLGQLRTTYIYACRHDPDLAVELEGVLDELTRRPVLAKRWEQHPENYGLGPNGRVRKVTVPIYGVRDGTEAEVGRRPVTVMLWSSLVMGTANTRITTLYPMKEADDGALSPYDAVISSRPGDTAPARTAASAGDEPPEARAAD